MRYKNYELRKTEDHEWEIVQWFPNNLVESCTVVMILRWDTRSGSLKIDPITSRIIQTYSVKNFDKWLDICLKFIELSEEEEDEK